MRRIARAKRPFADAEPEPLTFANLTTKSLTRCERFHACVHCARLSPPPCRRSARPRAACVRVHAVVGLRHVEQEFLHVPRAGRAALGAQAAVQADVLVLGHDAAGLDRHRRRTAPASRFSAGAISRVRRSASSPFGGERDAVHRADVDACVALDAQLVGEHRLHVAIEAALRFRVRELRIEPQLDLRADVLQRDDRVLERHAIAAIAVDAVVVAPLVDAHLLRQQVHVRRRALVSASPRQWRSIEIAASWPCATAQMMFFGPNAASPPK